MFFYNESDNEVSQVAPAPSDPYFYNTSLLLKMDSDFSDSSVHQHTATTVGNATITSAESKYGGASGYFDGSGDRLVISPAGDELEFGNEDYTVEFWMNPVPTLRGALFSKGLPNSLGADYLTCEFVSNGSLLYALGSHASGNPASNIITTTTFTTGQWYHIAIVRNGDTTSLYVNGTEDGSFNSSYTISTGGDFLIGRGWYFDVYNRDYNGYIDDFRVTKGVARYTANFTPPDSHPITGPSEIVSTDLQLHLDAGDTNSYSGTGTTWYDLSGNGNNVTLVNGVSYSPANEGTLIFDGVDDHADFFAPNLTTTATVEVWAKIEPNNYSSSMIFGWDAYDAIRYPGYGFGFNSGNGDNYGISEAEFLSLGLQGNWKHYVFEMRSDVHYSANKMYINGIEQLLSQQSGFESVGYRNFNNGNGRISGWRISSGHHMPMECGLFRVYNRSLSNGEVLQNFNATKTRFGL